MNALNTEELDGIYAPDGTFVPWFRSTRFSLMRSLAHLVLRATGWKVEGRVPDLPKQVAILGKHTSNWDAVWSVTLKYAILDLPVGWVMKNSAFKFPYRTVLLWLGCIPVDRNAPEGFVKQAARKFMEGKSGALSITPDGTRGKVDRWKTGFYRIAEECNVPIVLVFIDYERHVMGTGPAIWPSGDYDADMREIAAFYKNVTARHPHLAGEIR